MTAYNFISVEGYAIAVGGMVLGVGTQAFWVLFLGCAQWFSHLPFVFLTTSGFAKELPGSLLSLRVCERTVRVPFVPQGLLCVSLCVCSCVLMCVFVSM